MRQEPDFFGDRDLDLIYVAKKLKEALRLEDVLTAAGIDYLVETDHYVGGVLFKSERVGAFFYVPADAVEPVRGILEREGYRMYHGTGEAR